MGAGAVTSRRYGGRWRSAPRGQPLRGCRSCPVPSPHVRTLPVADPGRPDLRGPWRFLLRVAVLQRTTLLLGATYGVVWMLSQAVAPCVLGRAVDDGLVAGDADALLRWSGVLLALGAVQALTGMMRHRCAVANWLTAAYRGPSGAAQQAVRLGAGLGRQLHQPARSSRTPRHRRGGIGHIIDISARGAGCGGRGRRRRRWLLLAGDRCRSGCWCCSACRCSVLAVAPALRPLHARQARPARAARRADRRSAPTPSPGCACCAGSAARPSSGPLPAPVAAGAHRGRRRWPGRSRCWTRCRCCCPASSSCS